MSIERHLRPSEQVVFRSQRGWGATAYNWVSLGVVFTGLWLGGFIFLALGDEPSALVHFIATGLLMLVVHFALALFLALVTATTKVVVTDRQLLYRRCMGFRVEKYERSEIADVQIMKGQFPGPVLKIERRCGPPILHPGCRATRQARCRSHRTSLRNCRATLIPQSQVFGPSALLGGSHHAQRRICGTVGLSCSRAAEGDYGQQLVNPHATLGESGDFRHRRCSMAGLSRPHHGVIDHRRLSRVPSDTPARPGLPFAGRSDASPAGHLE